MVIIGVIISNYTINKIKKIQYNSIYSNNHDLAEHLRSFIREKITTSKTLAINVEFQELLDTPPSSPDYIKLKKLVTDNLATIIKINNQFFEIFLMDKTGRIVISSDTSKEGLDKSTDTLFTEAQTKTNIKSIYYSDVINKINYVISSPIIDRDGNFLGVIAIRYFPENFYDILKSKSSLGNTEENFLVSQERYFLSPSLFLGENVILKEKVETKNVTDCFDPSETAYVRKFGYFDLQTKFGSQIVEAKDYRNIDVIATHAFIPETNWCLISKIDKIDLLSYRQSIFQVFLIVSILGAVIFFLISLWISNKITDPIKNLQKATENMIKNDFDHQITKTSNDEVGVLTDSFNLMTKVIKEARTNVEEKIATQTKYLDDQKSAMFNILEDVEEEKLKAENISKDLAKFKLAVENASDQIIITDQTGVILFANRAASTITGFSNEEIIGQKAGSAKLWGGLMDLDVSHSSWNKIENNKKTLKKEFDNHRKSGEPYISETLVSPILNKTGQVIFFICIERDITRAKEVDRMKTDFIAVSSHQLRTPLTAMKWFLEMLLKNDLGKLNEKQKDAITNVDQSNEKMIDLVNSLLNISRMESGKLTLEPELSDIVKLTADIAKEAESKFKEKKQTLSINLAKNIPAIMFDPRMIRQVIINLLTNANKYTPNDGIIKIQLFKEDEDVVFEISDNGYGIPSAEQAKLFGRYFRASNVAKNDIIGTGLGLYLVKAIIKSSNGKIWFKSTQGKGTTFWFSLPMASAQPHVDKVKLN